MDQNKKIIKGIFILWILSSVLVHGATITVTNTNNAGAGTLRQAITDAAAGDDIIFSVTGTITLTTGELAINKNLTINGPGSSSLTISGNNSSRIFYIDGSSVTVNLSGLTITNGNSATIALNALTSLF